QDDARAVREPHPRPLRPPGRVLVHHDLARPSRGLPAHERPDGRAAEHDRRDGGRAEEARPGGPPCAGLRELRPEPARLPPPAELLPGGIHIPNGLRLARQPPDLLQRLEDLRALGVRRHPRPHLRRLLRRAAPSDVASEPGALRLVDLIDGILSASHGRRPWDSFGRTPQTSWTLTRLRRRSRLRRSLAQQAAAQAGEGGEGEGEGEVWGETLAQRLERPP